MGAGRGKCIPQTGMSSRGEASLPPSPPPPRPRLSWMWGVKCKSVNWTVKLQTSKAVESHVCVDENTVNVVERHMEISSQATLKIRRRTRGRGRVESKWWRWLTSSERYVLVQSFIELIVQGTSRSGRWPWQWWFSTSPFFWIRYNSRNLQLKPQSIQGGLRFHLLGYFLQIRQHCLITCELHNRLKK